MPMRPPPALELCFCLFCKDLSTVTCIGPHAFVSCPLPGWTGLSHFTSVCHRYSNLDVVVAAAPGPFKTDLRRLPPEIVLGGYEDSPFWRNTVWSVAGALAGGCMLLHEGWEVATAQRGQS